MKLRLDESHILWPGRKKEKPVGERIPTHLQVLTIEEKPFVYVRKIKRSEGETCRQDGADSNELPCPLLRRGSNGNFTIRCFDSSCTNDAGNYMHNLLSDSTDYCCYGYCMDLLVEIAKKINVTFNLTLSPDGQFGSYVARNDTGESPE